MPAETEVLLIQAVASPDAVRWADGDVVLLTMNSQDAYEALRTLANVAPSETPVVCVQNMVENECTTLRWFPLVYGVVVMWRPTSHLQLGVIQAFSVPLTALLDVDRYRSIARIAWVRLFTWSL